MTGLAASAAGRLRAAGGLCAYLSLYPTLACWLFARVFAGRHWSRWLLAFPALWLGADWLQGTILMTGYPGSGSATPR